MRYTLMNQEHEVLDFVFEAGSDAPEGVRACEGIAWAPLEIPVDGRDSVPALDRFLRRRALCEWREDVPQLLRSIDAGSPVELALLSGGFSLSDQYWYRREGSSLTWKGSNFFDNDWDPEFGEAILMRDYDALAHASSRTPDVTLGGLCRKAWVGTGLGLRLLKASPTGDEANVHCEALVSRMLERLVGPSGHVPYEPMAFGGETYSSCPVMLGDNDELVSVAQLLEGSGVDPSLFNLRAELGDHGRLIGICQQAMDERGVMGHRQALAKLFVTAALTVDYDTHPSNFGLVRDLETHRLRTAPLYDHGRGFLYMRDKLATVRKEPRVADLILGLYFSRLDPTWDYSWYDPRSLDGFEDDLTECLSAQESLPDGYAELMAGLFVKQRAYVSRVAASSCGGA